MPAGAVDCHNHIMGPRDKYPYAADRTYTPPEANVAALKALRARIGTARNVLVTPSVYGTDNRCLVDALAELAGSARGIAVLPLDVSDAELRRLDNAGVRGIRISLGGTGRYDSKTAPAALSSFATRFAPLGWNIEVVGNLAALMPMAPAMADLKVPVVLDHFAGANGGDGVKQEGFAALLDLVRGGNTYVKLSAPLQPLQAAPIIPTCCRLRAPSSKRGPTACCGAPIGRIPIRSRGVRSARSRPITISTMKTLSGFSRNGVPMRGRAKPSWSIRQGGFTASRDRCGENGS